MKLLLLVLGLWLMPLNSYAAFPDVSANHPHAEAIGYVKAQGIVEGNPDGTFKPDQNISRAAFTKIIVETYFASSQLQACAEGQTAFSDVPANAWFASYICVAANNGLVAGYPDGTFRPGDSINVVEAAKIISSYRQGEQTGTPWFKPYLDDLGAVGAIPTQVTAVDQTVTRGLMAEIIHRLKADITTKSAHEFDGTGFVARASAAAQASTTIDTPVANIGVETEAEVMVKNEPVYEVFSNDRYQALLDSGEKFVLNFSASWCPNCQRLKRTILADLEALPAGTIILETDYDEYTELKAQYGVTRQTTGVFIENGAAVETKSGLSFGDIETFFE